MNPFKVGDSVYHPAYEKPLIVYEVEDDCVRIKEKGDRVVLPWMSYKVLSFTPWPKANHERPIEDGWWVCTGTRSDDPYVREVRYGKVRSLGKEFNLKEYTFHKYLGKDWK